MKVSGVLSVMALLVSGWITAYGQVVESEVPGDHFSLEGALELFKTSSSPEEFEKMLNSPDSKVNNLDLNGDGYVDYIRVLNRTERNVHLFILQAVISEHESQDVATIELEKLANGKAVLQIVGNEDIYGVTTIIEPTQEVRTYAGTRSSATVVNVWAWPSVQYVYGPYYHTWVSPWGWHMRPVWYRTWRPLAYVSYYHVWNPYRPFYTVCHTRRVAYAHHIYHPYRTRSVIVHNRHHRQIDHYRSTYRSDTRNGRTRDDSRNAYIRDESRSPQGGRRDAYNMDTRSSLQQEARSRREAQTSNAPRTSVPVRRELDRNQRSSNIPDSREEYRQITREANTNTRTYDPNSSTRQRTQQPQQPRTSFKSSGKSSGADIKRSQPVQTRSSQPQVRSERRAPDMIQRNSAPSRNAGSGNARISAPVRSSNPGTFRNSAPAPQRITKPSSSPVRTGRSQFTAPPKSSGGRDGRTQQENKRGR